MTSSLLSPFIQTVVPSWNAATHDFKYLNPTCFQILLPTIRARINVFLLQNAHSFSSFFFFNVLFIFIFKLIFEHFLHYIPNMVIIDRYSLYNQKLFVVLNYYFFVTALLSCDSHTIRFTHLKNISFTLAFIMFFLTAIYLHDLSLLLEL